MAENYLNVALRSSPHVWRGVSVRDVMRTVVLSLLPVVAVSVYLFGLSALFLIFVTCLSCLVTECLYCKLVKKECTRVVLTEDLPEDVKVKYVVAQTDAYPDVLLKGCTIRCNRARGILLGSRGKIVIDSNYFHSAGASILFEGDGSYWYEQGGVRDVEICRNVFENGNYGSSGWGSACIAVGTGLWNDRETSRYHRNLKIHDNVFRVFDPRILNLYCVDGIDFQNNTIEMTNDYIYNRQETRRFVYENCDGVRIEE